MLTRRFGAWRKCASAIEHSVAVQNWSGDYPTPFDLNLIGHWCPIQHHDSDNSRSPECKLTKDFCVPSPLMKRVARKKRYGHSFFGVGIDDGFGRTIRS